jgi:hypothetical protein
MSTLDERSVIFSDFLPLCRDYSELLHRVINKKKITIEAARKKYKFFTYGQWRTLLGIKCLATLNL